MQITRYQSGWISSRFGSCTQVHVAPKSSLDFVVVLPFSQPRRWTCGCFLTRNYTRFIIVFEGCATIYSMRYTWLISLYYWSSCGHFFWCSLASPCFHIPSYSWGVGLITSSDVDSIFKLIKFILVIPVPICGHLFWPEDVVQSGHLLFRLSLCGW